MAGDDKASGYGLSPVRDAASAEAPRLAYRPRLPRSYRPAIGLIGCGGISEYHLRAYRKLGLSVVALCDRHRERAEARRTAFFPSARILTDWRDVLRADDIEVVDVATHPSGRVEILAAALEAGKHVLSQKPFVLDLRDGRRLADLAEARGRRLAVNQNGRWAPHLSYIAEAIRTGLLGDVGSVDIAMQWDHTWTKGTAFEDQGDLVLFDFGIHFFDAAARFLGKRKATHVYASAGRAVYQEMRPPMLAEVAIDYPGAQARMAFNGHVTLGQEDRTVVCGSKGTLRSFGPSLSIQSIELHTEAGLAHFQPEGTWFEDGFQGAMTELLCAIEEGREPDHSARGNLTSLELCFAALASVRTGQPHAPGSVAAPPTAAASG
ncbi:MAG TPA: Gfo/Idh/MocA family oxidoreductase [Opitutaceae bacterium]|jgi:predicted dehydrogenase